MSVMIGNEANRTNNNIKQPSTFDSFCPVGSFYMTVLVKMFANRTGWFVLPYVTKHNNEMSLNVIYCQQLLECIENT